MIKARHKRWAKALWDIYLPFLWRRHFRALEADGGLPFIDSSRSLLVLPNHISWWDGFIWYLANKYWFHKRFHILMLEDTLRQNFFFRYLGGFSVRKGNRSVAETFRYAEELLADSRNVVVIFPQGQIQSQFEQHPVLEQGMLKLIDRCENVQVLMARAYTEYGSHKKPALHIRMKEFKGDSSAFTEAFAQLLRN